MNPLELALPSVEKVQRRYLSCFDFVTSVLLDDVTVRLDDNQRWDSRNLILHFQFAESGTATHTLALLGGVPKQRT